MRVYSRPKLSRATGNAELVRAGYEAFAAQDVEGTLTFLDSDIEVHEGPSWPSRRVWRGIEGFLGGQRQFTETFEDVRFDEA